MIRIIPWGEKRTNPNIASVPLLSRPHTSATAPRGGEETSTSDCTELRVFQGWKGKENGVGAICAVNFRSHII